MFFLFSHLFPTLPKFFSLRAQLSTIKSKQTLLRQLSECEYGYLFLSILTSKNTSHLSLCISLPALYNISLSKHTNIFTAFQIKSKCLELLFKHLFKFASTCISGLKASFTQTILFCFLSFFYSFWTEKYFASSPHLHYIYLFAYVFSFHLDCKPLGKYHVFTIILSPRSSFTLFLVRTVNMGLWHLCK